MIDMTENENQPETAVASSDLFGLRPYCEEAAVTIYHGDCRQIVPMLGHFDLLLTDPPYGIGADLGAGKSAKKWTEHTGKERWDESTPPRWLMDMLREKSDWQVIWGGNYFELPPSPCWLFWDKETAGVTTFADGEMAWTNLPKAVRMVRHLWSGPYMKVKEVRHHPTQKPLQVIQWAIQQAGDVHTILDPFAGSGTTGEAAKLMGKKAVLIEREERYCEVAARRLAQDVLPLDCPNENSDGTAASEPEPNQ